MWRRQIKENMFINREDMFIRNSVRVEFIAENKRDLFAILFGI